MEVTNKRSVGLLLPVLSALTGLAMLLGILGFISHGYQHTLAATRKSGSNIVVDTLEDESINDGNCSLREAVTAANTNTAVDACPAGETLTDTITFSTAGIITFTGLLTVTPGGSLVIDGSDVITTSGGGITRVWWVEAGSDLTLKNLAVVDGYFDRSDFDVPGGIALYNAGKVTIIQCTFSNSASAYYGEGAIYNDGTIIFSNSSLVRNGGLYSEAGIVNGGSFTIIQSNISDNYSAYGNPAIWNGGNMTITDSIVSHNESFKNAGGISNLGVLVISNSTIAHNVSSFVYTGHAGGIENRGALRVINSTLADNYSGSSGGIESRNDNSAFLVNTIIAYSGSKNCYGSFVDGGHNIASDNSCNLDPANGSFPNTDPLLGPLQDNGGATWTQALLPGSPAIDAANYAECPFTDQRGFYRPVDGDGDGGRACDIGAYEFGSIDPWGITLSPRSQQRDGLRDATLTYSLDLTNRTGITDTYNLVLGPHDWETHLATDTLGPLSPEDSQALTLTVTIPTMADWYQTETVILTATSVTTPTRYITFAQVLTRAVPPFAPYLPVILK